MLTLYPQRRTLKQSLQSTCNNIVMHYVATFYDGMWLVGIIREIDRDKDLITRYP